MSWIDDLLPVSFRGIPFYVEAHQHSGGRRKEVHEFPQRERPFVEDLGRRARSYRVRGYVIGHDYFRLRDDLVKACEASTDGRLVHPYLGELRVHCRSYTLQEARTTGGLARFDIDFVEAGAAPAPDIEDDTPAQARAAAITVESVADEVFLTHFDIAGLPDDAVSALASSARALGPYIESLPTTAGILSEAGLRLALDALAALPSGGLTAEDVVGRVGSVFSAAMDAALARDVVAVASTGNPLDLCRCQDAARDALRDLMGYRDSLPTVAAMTPTRRRQAAAQGALASLVEHRALAKRGALLSLRGFASRDAAEAARGAILSDIDASVLRAGDEGDDDIGLALRDLSYRVSDDLTRRAADLAPLVSISTARPLPSLVVAHALYEDVARADEIEGRAGAWAPAFLPREPEVLAA